MSADGVGTIGFGLAVAALPVVLAGATIVGVIRGAGKLADFISERNRIRNTERMRAEAQRARDLARIDAQERQQISALMERFEERKRQYSASVENLQGQREAKTHALSEDLTKLLSSDISDMRRVEQQALERLEAIEQGWQQQSRIIEDTYSSQLGQVTAEIQEQLITARSNFERMATSTDQTRIRNEAMSQYQMALSAIKAVQIELGYVPDYLNNGIRETETQINQNLFVQAYSLAAEIQLQCFDVIREGLIKLAQRENIEDRIIYQKAILEGAISAARHFEFTYENETLTEDLSRFSPTLFAGIQNRYNSILNTSTNAPAEKLDQLCELNEDFSQWRRMALRQLLCAYAENDYSGTVAAVMEEQGFRVEDYAYEGDVEGRPIHINFVNDVSNDRLTIVLSPNPGNGTLHVDVHHYGDGVDVDTRMQENIRQKLSEKLDISISCERRGEVSNHTEAANLDSIRTINPGMPLI